MITPYPSHNTEHSSAATSHLSDGQISDLLSGLDPGPALEAHLATCAPCRDEVASLGATLGSFNDVGLRWAELEAPRRIQTPSVWTLHFGRPMWGLGFATLAAALAVAVSTSFPLRTTPAPPAAAMTSVEPSATELAEDNRLMLSVNRALHYDAPSAITADTSRGVADTPRSTDASPAPISE